jgi:hypothetical protein
MIMVVYMRKIAELLLALSLVFTAQSALAQRDDLDDEHNKLPHGYVRSADGPLSGISTADHLALTAQYMVNNQYYDRAILVCQKALRKNDDDCDVHKVYAEALEGKLRKDKKDNPELYVTCLKEWLIVFRNEKGDERGMTIKGIGIPGIMGANQDEDHTMEAKAHLYDLTGTLPRPWEPDFMFIKRVTKKANTSVAGRLLNKTFDAPPGAASIEDSEELPVNQKGRAAPAEKSSDPLDWLKQ